MLNTYLADLRDLPMSQIKDTYFDAVLREKEKTSPAMAVRLHKILQSLETWARPKKAWEGPSMDTVYKPGHAAKEKLALSHDATGAIWNAALELGYPWGDYTRMMILLGRRRHCVSVMKWEDINFKKTVEIIINNKGRPEKKTIKIPVWEIPAADDKSGNLNICPLPPSAVEILKNVPRIDGSPFVFTTTGKTPISGFSKAVEQLQKLSKTSDWSFHSFRRTCRTGLSECGVPQHIAKLSIGHAVAGIDSKYDKYAYIVERKDAIESWARLVERIAGGEVNKIESLESRRAG